MQSDISNRLKASTTQYYVPRFQWDYCFSILSHCCSNETLKSTIENRKFKCQKKIDIGAKTFLCYHCHIYWMITFLQHSYHFQWRYHEWTISVITIVQQVNPFATSHVTVIIIIMNIYVALSFEVTQSAALHVHCVKLRYYRGNKLFQLITVLSKLKGAYHIERVNNYALFLIM